MIEQRANFEIGTPDPLLATPCLRPHFGFGEASSRIAGGFAWSQIAAGCEEVWSQLNFVLMSGDRLRDAVANYAITQSREIDSQSGRCFWKQAVICKSGDRVDFENPRLVLKIEAKINSRQAPSANRGTGIASYAFQRFHYRLWNIRVENISSLIVFIFCLPVEEWAIGFDLDGG